MELAFNEISRTPLLDDKYQANERMLLFSTEEVHHIFSKECFSQNSLADFVESISTLDLFETNVNPDDKHFHFTTHHGQQELTELWNRIKNSPFVIYVGDEDTNL